MADGRHIEYRLLAITRQYMAVSKSTHRFAEWQKNLTSQSVEIVRRSCKVTHKPVDLMQLLHLKVLIFWLQNHVVH